MNNAQITPGEVHNRFDNDLFFFAEHAPLKIKDEQGRLVVWRPNIAQRHTHDLLEAQRRKFGWCRAIIVKGRQMGESTYVQGRFYHKTSRPKPGQGLSAFVLSHEGKTTERLFQMVERFQDNVHASMRPTIGKQNTRQMTFPLLGSDYAAGTAGNEDVARGGTSQLFHGSEAAYWEHGYAIEDGALQTIALAPGTEIILESTANGPKGMFYDKFQKALHGVGDYILIFCPWFWDERYERVDDGSPLTEEEEKFVAAYFTGKIFPYHQAPIDTAQVRRKMLWRRGKIIDLMKGNNNFEGGKAKFKSIYPSNPTEAFLATAVGLIRPDAIEMARALRLLPDDFAARIGGCDPAGEGKKADRTLLAIRQGRCLEKALKWPKMQPMELAGKLARLIDDEGLDMLFIDRGYGEGTMYRLWEMGYKKRVIGVWFQESAASPLYINKRTEIIIEAAKWLNEGGVSIPDGKEGEAGAGPGGSTVCGGDEIHADLAAMPLDRETSNGIKCIPAKEEIVKALGRSPDIYDGLALTFAHPIKKENIGAAAGSGWKRADSGEKIGSKHGGPLSSMNKRRTS